MLYGTQWAIPSCRCIRSLRSKIISSVWGTGSRLRCAEVILDILFDPTALDPTYAIALRTILVARRMLAKDAARRTTNMRTVRTALERLEARPLTCGHGFGVGGEGSNTKTLKKSHPSLNVPGPIHGLIRAATLIDAKLKYSPTHCDVLLCFPSCAKAYLLGSPADYLATLIREAARHSILSHLVNRIRFANREKTWPSQGHGRHCGDRGYQCDDGITQ